MIFVRDYRLALLSFLLGIACGTPDQYFRVRYDDYYDEDDTSYDFGDFEIKPPDSDLITSLVNIGLKVAESFQSSTIFEKNDNEEKVEPKIVELIE